MTFTEKEWSLSSALVTALKKNTGLKIEINEAKFEQLDVQAANWPGSLEYSSECQRLLLIGQGISFQRLSQIIHSFLSGSASVFIRLNEYDHLCSATAIDLLVFGHFPISHEKLLTSSAEFNIDICKKPKAKLDQRGLIVFDMDSTLIEMECIDEIAKLGGIGDKVAQVTELAMQGKIDFSQSLHDRVRCLKNVEIEKLESIRSKLPFSPGLETMVNTLKKKGWILAIASGGFTYFADYLKATFGFDYALSNRLEEDQGKLTGNINGQIVDAQKKAELLVSLADEHNIERTQCIAVGDGANDLIMMNESGYGLAYHAKPAVQSKASGSIRFHGLDSVVYLLS